MSTISVTIPDDQLQRVIEALCARPFLTPAPPGVAIVPATGAAAKQILIDWVKANVVAYEVETAKAAVEAPDTDGLVT